MFYSMKLVLWNKTRDLDQWTWDWDEIQYLINWGLTETADAFSSIYLKRQEDHYKNV